MLVPWGTALAAPPWLNGGIGNDTLFGGADNDRLNGDDGSDRMEGGAGGDTLTGGDGTGRDMLSYESSGGAVSVDLFLNLAFNLESSGDANGDQFSGFEDLTGSQRDDDLFGNDDANKIVGLNGSDLIEGDGGNDTLQGSAGNDTIFGGNDADSLTGGQDADTFRFEVTTAFGEHGGDVITDFDVNQDRLQIEGLGAYIFQGSLSDLEITQNGANTIITYDWWEGSITLVGVDRDDLVANADNVFTFIG